MSIWKTLRNGAADTIAKLGHHGRLFEVYEGAYNPDTTERARTVIPHRVMYVEDNRAKVEPEAGINGQYDTTIYLVYPHEINENWEFETHRHDKLTVVEAIPIEAQGNTVLWELRCRKR
jgi:hypothetical protein